AVDDVGKLVVGNHVIELRRWLVVPGAPGLATVEADRGSLVRAENHACRIFRIDPKLVIVVSARRAAYNRNCLATIFGAIERDIRHVEDIGIVRIDGDAVEIPGTTRKSRVGVREKPGVASIIGTIQASLLRLNDRVDTLAIRRNVDADASPIAV